MKTILINRIRRIASTLSSPPITPGDAILMESGDYLLLESGDKILLEA